MSRTPSDFMNGFKSFMQNPAGHMGIPAQFASDPNGAIQYLMNSGKVTQEQFNQARQMAEQMKSNPAYQQFFKR